MANKYFDGKVNKAESIEDDLDRSVALEAAETVKKFTEQFDEYHNADAVETLMSFVRRCNKYIDETTPWALAKSEEDKPRLTRVIYTLLEAIRVIGVLLSPIAPETSDKIFEQLGCEKCTDNFDAAAEFGTTKEFAVGEPSPLFVRLDTEKVLEEIAADDTPADTRPENITTLDEISIDDFAKVELRTAKIVNCEPIPKAKKLLKLTLDDGSRNSRIVASGIAKWYKPEELTGHTVIVVANLKPATLCGVESNGMILAADAGEDDVKVIFCDNIPAGSKVR